MFRNALHGEAFEQDSPTAGFAGCDRGVSLQKVATRASTPTLGTMIASETSACVASCCHESEHAYQNNMLANGGFAPRRAVKQPDRLRPNS